MCVCGWGGGEGGELMNSDVASMHPMYVHC